MATTPPPWSLPYPVGTDRVADGDNAMQAISERVAALLAESIIKPPASAPCAVSPGWSGAADVYFRSGWVALTYDVTLPSGLWSPGSVLATIPAGFVPSRSRFGFAMLANSGTEHPVSVDGTGSLAAGASGPGATNNRLVGTFVYPLGG